MDTPADPPPDDDQAVLRQRLARLRGAPRRVRTAAVALLAGLGVLVLVLVVSGGDGAGRDPEAEFRAQARTICATAQRQIAELRSPADLADLVRVARRAARISGRTRSDLAALEPPVAIRADMPALLESLKRQQRLANQLAASAARGSRSGVRRLIARGQREDVRTGRAAQRIGLQTCAATRGDG